MELVNILKTVTKRQREFEVTSGKCNAVGIYIQGNSKRRQHFHMFWMQNAFCCGVAILQHGLPWRRRPETVSRVNYKQTLRVFQTIVVYTVIVGSLVTLL
jgi:hypothetical protein